MSHKKTAFMLIAVLTGVVLLFSGCNWFDNGFLNVLNPRAEVTLYYTLLTPDEIGNKELLSAQRFNLTIFPLNEVGFTIERLHYSYRSSEREFPELSHDMVTAYYVPPIPYTDQFIPGPGTSPFAITNLPLISQDGIDFLWKNPQVRTLFLTLTAHIRDDAGNHITKKVIDDFAVLQMAEDFEPPVVSIEVSGRQIGESYVAGEPITFIMDAEDNHLIASYCWLIDGVGSAKGKIMIRSFKAGTYAIVAEACDMSGNCGYAAVTINVVDPEEPEVPPPPEVSIRVSGARLVAGSNYEAMADDPVTFIMDVDEKNQIALYRWLINGIVVSEGKKVEVLQRKFEAGTYAIVAEVCDASGKCGYDAVTIKAEAPSPEPDDNDENNNNGE